MVMLAGGPWEAGRPIKKCLYCDAGEVVGTIQVFLLFRDPEGFGFQRDGIAHLFGVHAFGEGGRNGIRCLLLSGLVDGLVHLQDPGIVRGVVLLAVFLLIQSLSSFNEAHPLSMDGPTDN